MIRRVKRWLLGPRWKVKVRFIWPTEPSWMTCTVYGIRASSREMAIARAIRFSIDGMEGDWIRVVVEEAAKEPRDE